MELIHLRSLFGQDQRWRKHSRTGVFRWHHRRAWKRRPDHRRQRRMATKCRYRRPSENFAPRSGPRPIALRAECTQTCTPSPKVFSDRTSPVDYPRKSPLNDQEDFAVADVYLHGRVLQDDAWLLKRAPLNRPKPNFHVPDSFGALLLDQLPFQLRFSVLKSPFCLAEY